MKSVNIYTPEGWLDIPAIADMGCWLNVFIGPRQVGKTYGVIKYLMENDCYHMYMRRTIDEFDVITDDPDLNPYLDMEQEGYHVDLQKKGKGWIIGDVDISKEDRPIIKRRGIGMPLSRIAKIRGFSGQKYSDLVFDEFIPEELVVVRNAEGDAFRNALISISGNREKKGKPPLRVWMLANSNDLFNPILMKMNLVKPVESMIRRDEEFRMLENGVCIVLPKSEKIISDRMESPMLRHLNDDSEFAGMAFGNKFAYNDTSLVKPKNLKGWKPFLRVSNFYIWVQGDAYYVSTSAHHKGEHFGDSRDEQIRCGMMYPEMVLLYRLGRITFSDAVVLYNFRNYFGIK